MGCHIHACAVISLLELVNLAIAHIIVQVSQRRSRVGRLSDVSPALVVVSGAVGGQRGAQYDVQVI